MSEKSRTLIRRPRVEEKTGLGRSAIYEMIADGLFPRPVPLGSKSVGWIEHEVDAWIDARIAERDVPPDQRQKPARKRARRTAEAHASA